MLNKKKHRAGKDLREGKKIFKDESKHKKVKRKNNTSVGSKHKLKLFASTITDLKVTDEVKNTLSKMKIKSFKDLRNIGLLKQHAKAKNIPKVVAHKIEAHARLNLISKNIEVNDLLINSKMDSINSIAKASINAIIKTAKSKINKKQAQELKKAAKGIHIQLENQLSELLIDRAPNHKGWGDLYNTQNLPPEPKVKSLINNNLLPDENRCPSCNPESSVFSPSFYLLDLINFTAECFGLTLVEAENKFYQSIGELICGPEKQIRQIDLAIDILEKYILKQRNKNYTTPNLDSLWDEFKQLDANEYYSNVLIKLVDSYLSELGTSREEIKKAKNNGTSQLLAWDLHLYNTGRYSGDPNGYNPRPDLVKFADTNDAVYKRSHISILQKLFENSTYFKCRKIIYLEYYELYKAEKDEKLKQTIQEMISCAVEEAIQDAITQNPEIAIDTPEYEALITTTEKQAREDLEINEFKLFIKQEKYSDLLEEGINQDQAEQQAEAFANEKYAEIENELPQDISPEEKEKLLEEKYREYKSRIIYNQINAFHELIDSMASTHAEIQLDKNIEKASSGFLMKIRKNLIALVESHNIFDAKVEILENLLHIDLKVDECYKTTKTAQAIQTVQSYIMAVRMGKETPLENNFDRKQWAWMKTYGMWHAAQMVYFYPENFLENDFRYNKTFSFKYIESLLEEEDLEGTEALQKYIECIYDTDKIHIIGSSKQNEGIFIFGIKCINKHELNQSNAWHYDPQQVMFYYSIIKNDEFFTGWKKLEEITDIKNGNWRLISNNNKIYLYSLQYEVEEIDSDKHYYGNDPEYKNYLSIIEFDPIKYKANYLGEKFLFKSECVVDDNICFLINADNRSENNYGFILFYAGVLIDYLLLLRDETREVIKRVIRRMCQGFVLDTEFNYISNFKFELYKDEKDFIRNLDSDPFNPPIVNNKILSTVPLYYKQTDELVACISFNEASYVFRVDINKANPYPQNWLHISKCYYHHLSTKIELNFPIIVPVNEQELLIFDFKYTSSGQEGVPSQIMSYVRKYNKNTDKVTAQLDLFDNSHYFDFTFHQDVPYVFYSLPQDYISSIINLQSDDTHEFILFTAHGTRIDLCLDSSLSEFIINDTYKPKLCWFPNIPLEPILHCADIDQLTEVFENQSDILLQFRPIPYIYYEEIFFHFPLYYVEKLHEKEMHDKATSWLNLIYQPLNSDYEDRKIYKRFPTQQTQADRLLIVFNPYNIAGSRYNALLRSVILKYVEVILDWADSEFAKDTGESRNRARELYKLARFTLRLDEAPKDFCTSYWKEFTLEVIEYFDEVTHRGISLEINKLRSSFNVSKNKAITEKIRGILGKNNTPTKKKAQVLKAIFNEKNKNQPKQTKLLHLYGAKSETDSGAKESLIFSVMNYNPNIGSFPPNRVFPGAIEPFPIQVEIIPQYIDFGFCIPTNSLLEILRYRIESNLQKLQTCRNFAGLKQRFQPYSTPVDPEQVLEVLAGGGSMEDLDSINLDSPVPVYRYTYLLEQAKKMISEAMHIESQFLGAEEKYWQTSYEILRAKQDISVARSHVALQSLRLKEASDSIKQASLQLDKVDIQIKYYKDLIESGWLSEEKGAYGLLIAASVFYGISAAAATTLAILTTKEPWAKAIAGIEAGASGAAQTLSTISSVLSMKASFKRRAQEWKHQLKLANADYKIAGMGVTLAEDRYSIFNKEKEIAQLNQQHANDTLQFLENNRFTGAKLYNWMRKELKKIYRNQLYIALGIARMAQQALAFEQQKTITYIKHNYWEGEHQGLLGSEKLLRDINKLEEYRVQSEVRKRENTKVISFACYAPGEFQRFKQTGRMEFTPLMEWFDRDFPGQYMRLIKRINLTIIALIPPSEQIHATLSDNNGLSRVMSGPPWEDYKTIYRQPEAVSISFTQQATGLFEANLHDPMLLPFESKGVDTSFSLDMPKGANRFDYNSLFDVIMTMEYTTMEDLSYRDIVLKNMGIDENGWVPIEGMHYVTMHNQFPDQWYKFHNTPGPNRQLEFEVTANMFPHNEDIKQINLFNLAVLQDETQDIDVTVEFDGTTETVSIQDGMIQDEFKKRKFNGKKPFGLWKITVTNSTQAESLKDLILVVNYKGKVKY